MELGQRVDELEAELKIIKNEVQSVLLDIRERVLSYYDNPFQLIEAKAPSSKGDVDATLSAGGGPSSPAAEPKMVEEKKGQETIEGAKRMEEAAAESGQLKALAEQMQQERQALEQEKQALEQERQAMAQAAQAAAQQPMVGGVSPGGQAPYGAPGFPPGGPTPQMPGYPSGQQAQQIGQPPFPGPGTPPLQHHLHQRVRPEGPPQQAGGRPFPGQQPDREGRRGPASGPAASDYRRPRSPGGADAEDRRGEDRRFGARRMPPGARRPVKDQIEGDELEKEETAEGTQVNLMTLIGLVRWVEKSIKKIGKDRVEAIVEIYRTAGYLPSNCKDIIPQIIRLAEDEKPDGIITMGDSISVLLQLDSLLGGKFRTESAVLSTLFDDDGGYPWTKQ